MMRGEIVEPFHHDYWVATMYTHQLDFWTPDNPGAKYPHWQLPAHQEKTIGQEWE